MGSLHPKKDGTIRWSQPLSKAWQYVKKKLMLTRADLTLYSTRHLMADWLDNEAIAQRTRDRILGQASDVRGRYGPQRHTRSANCSEDRAA
jgi:hypothetical protein